MNIGVAVIVIIKIKLLLSFCSCTSSAAAFSTHLILCKFFRLLCPVVVFLVLMVANEVLSIYSIRIGFCVYYWLFPIHIYIWLLPLI